MLLQHDVGVRPRDAERIHACPPWPLATVGPLHGLGRYPHRQAFPVQARIGIPEVQVLRDHPGLHDHRRLDEPGHPGRRLEVADVGLDGADEQRLIGFTPSPVDRDRGIQLDGISHRGTGPVRLEVVHFRRRQARPGQRGFDDLLQRGGIGHRQSHAGPAVVDRGATDHGPDPVAIGFRFAEALQNHDSAPFASHVAVGGRIECLALAIRRQHHRIRPELVHAAVQHGVDAARDGQVRLALLEIRHRVVNRDQGRCAGRIHGLRRSHQPQHERDSSRGAIHVRAAQGVETSRRLRGPGGVEHQHPVLVGADSGVDAGSGAFQPIRVDSRVLERVPARLEHHALLRVEKLRLHRRDPEERRVEAVDVVDEGPEAAGRAACRLVGIHLAHAPDAGARLALAYRIPAALQKTPEVGKVPRAGEAAGDADDGDGGASFGALRRAGLGGSVRFQVRTAGPV